ncbi:methyltransferase FkbM [Parafrankia soli]|uniref:Methyltransferase FkbM n=1 Tax=Parafrankia soli TaxID=2599596 RepID=A0A1S1PG14_9ACTN|nr:FkbM family methyltransferase [Parafrankia soli]OHV20141.1 methyltransferase FkbM [Parafrankia soli]
MKLLVTGGSGFLGRRVVTRALDRGHRITVLVRGDRAEQIVRQLGAESVRGDLDDPAAVDRAFHAVAGDALVSIASLGTGHATTIIGAAERAGSQRAVFVSTTGIFTTLDPPSKQVRTAAEETIQRSDLDWTIIRPTMIYGGPDDRNMARLLALLARCPVLPVPGGGHHLQQPVHVDDLAEVVLNVLTTDVAVRRCYNIAGPTALTFREIVTAAGDAVGRRVVCLPVPVGPVRALVGAYERRADRPRLKSEQIARLVEDKHFPIEDARTDLGFAPRSFTDGIRAEARLLRAAERPRARSSSLAAFPATSTPARTPARGKVLVSDLLCINVVAGPYAALRFAAAVATNIRAVVSTGTLTAADEAMAGREWTFRPLDGVKITLPGTAFGGAREMYCRGVYFALPGYAPAAGEVVVDLGANQGLFSVLAARAGADVIAVEAQRGFAALLARHARANDVSHRIQLVHALVGSGSGVLSDPAARRTATHWDGEVEDLRLTDVLERGGVDHVDLLKMDIEGSEFALFGDPGWLAAVDRIVMEVHPPFGSPAALKAILDRHGFDATLLDNASRVCTDLGEARSGYLYAHRRSRIPSSRGPAGGTSSGSAGVTGTRPSDPQAVSDAGVTA